MMAFVKTVIPTKVGADETKEAMMAVADAEVEEAEVDAAGMTNILAVFKSKHSL